MKVFGDAARCYDLLYRDKDYAGEAQFLHNLLQCHFPGARTLLDLGCGTGRHAAHLVQEDYEIHGVELSGPMVARAQDRWQQLAPDRAGRLTFSQGDLRTIRLGGLFDAVLALFHVVSYQLSNDDLRAALVTAREHLKPGGGFIFDYWYGPAVLTDRPGIRVKRVEDEAVRVTRVAEPVMQANDNLVDINYQFFLQDKVSGRLDTFQETHRLRYLFKPEIDLLLKETGFQHLLCRAWLSDQEPGFDTWSVYSVAKK
ncbi:MAG: methyltransferase type 11 [Deltaproteobacteria bacterium RBG_13_60_28]|nr:MAG: methyltransferase type 11 [Deltaproteobacteria bacterium RBG_13_60_28]